MTAKKQLVKTRLNLLILTIQIEQERVTSVENQTNGRITLIGTQNTPKDEDKKMTSIASTRASHSSTKIDRRIRRRR